MSLSISSVSAKSSFTAVSAPENKAESPNESFEETVVITSKDVSAQESPSVFPTFKGSLSNETMQTLLKMHSR